MPFRTVAEVRKCYKAFRIPRQARERLAIPIQKMDLNPLYPVGGNHAIQNVAFVFEWPSPLGEGEFAALRQLHQDQLVKEFPKLDTPQVLTFNLQPGGAPAVMAPQMAAGVHFIRPKQVSAPGDGVSAMVQVNPLNCVVVVNDYTRWAEVFESVTRWLKAILPIVVKDRPVAAMALQYTDSFEWRGNPRDFRTELVFRKETNFLPPNVFAQSGQWHSHHGYFDGAGETDEYLLLDNVNVTVGDDPASLKRGVSIVTNHKVTYKEALWGADNVLVQLQDVMNLLHAKNKSVLSDLLADDIKQKIKLVSN